MMEYSPAILILRHYALLGAVDAGTCNLIGTVFDPCDETADCAQPQLQCTDNTCLKRDGVGCTANDQCHNSCINAFCAVFSPLFGPCNDNEDCVANSGLECSGGVCLLKDEEFCAANNQCTNTCIGSSCAPLGGLFGACDSGDPGDCGATGYSCPLGTCYLANGEACGSDNDMCLHTCIDGDCADRSAIAQPCDAGDNSDCATNTGVLQCASNSNTCRRPNGQGCSSNVECAEACIDGTCAVAAVLGQQCDAGESSDCATADLVCTAEGVCLRGNTESCTSNSQCQNTCIGEVCRVYADQGQACDVGDDQDCSGSQLECSSASNTCLRKNEVDCAINTECSGTCIALKCADVSALGGDCDTGDIGDCGGAGYTCPSGTCFLANGEVCSGDNSECLGTCVGNECVATPVLGGDCDDTADCNNVWLECDASHTCLTVNDGECAENSECSNVCINSTCADQSPLGGPCDANQLEDCAGRDTLCPDGTCLLVNGQHCSSNAECANTCIAGECKDKPFLDGACDDSEDCALSMLECTPGGICRRQNGEECETNVQCSNTCIFSYCQDISSLDGECDEPSDCFSILDCLTGSGVFKCYKRNSEPCSTNDECIGVCIDNLCSDPSSYEGTCDETADCVSGLGLVCNNRECLVADGGPCLSNAQCINFCILSSCGPLSQLNGPCEDSGDCLSPLTCNSTTCVECVYNNQCNEVCIDQTCAAQSPLDGPCDEDADCSGDNRCNNGICRSCSDNSDCISEGGGGRERDTTALPVCVNGSCQSQSSEGGACDETLDCVFYQSLTCAGGICEPRSCTQNQECDYEFGQSCISNECLNRSGLGGLCDDVDDCSTSMCVDDVCVDCVTANDCNANHQCDASGLCVECIVNQDCSGQESCVFNHCEAKSGQGGDCDDSGDCIVPLSCVGETCAYVSCNSNSEWYVLLSVDWNCVGLFVFGAQLFA